MTVGDVAGGSGTKMRQELEGVDSRAVADHIWSLISSVSVTGRSSTSSTSSTMKTLIDRRRDAIRRQRVSGQRED